MSNSTTNEVLNNIEKQVNEDGFNGTLHISCEDYGVIKTALELQILKKPIFDDETLAYYCPNCIKVEAYEVDGLCDYCDLCGQALDWSDEE